MRVLVGRARAKTLASRRRVEARVVRGVRGPSLGQQPEELSHFGFQARFAAGVCRLDPLLKFLI